MLGLQAIIDCLNKMTSGLQDISNNLSEQIATRQKQSSTTEPNSTPLNTDDEKWRDNIRKIITKKIKENRSNNEIIKKLLNDCGVSSVSQLQFSHYETLLSKIGEL